MPRTDVAPTIQFNPHQTSPFDTFIYLALEYHISRDSLLSIHFYSFFYR